VKRKTDNETSGELEGKGWKSCHNSRREFIEGGGGTKKEIEDRRGTD